MCRELAGIALVICLLSIPAVAATTPVPTETTDSPGVLVDRQEHFDVSGNGSVLEISGSSNREDGTAVTVELLDDSGRPVALGLATVEGETATWTTTLNISAVSPGEYTIVAQTALSSTQQRVSIPLQTDTPTRDTPAETPWPTESETATPTPAMTQTGSPTPQTDATAGPVRTTNPTETTGDGLVLTPLVTLVLIVFGVWFYETRAETL